MDKHVHLCAAFKIVDSLPKIWEGSNADNRPSVKFVGVWYMSVISSAWKPGLHCSF